MKLYCIGTGPGNPDLLTEQAVKILTSVALIVSGVSSLCGDAVAEETLRKRGLLDGKRIYHFKYARPDRLGIAAYWEGIADEICQEMDGQDAALITGGDPFIFSSAAILKPLMEERGADVEYINGITSISATAKELNVPLLMKDETLIVTSGTYPKNMQKYREMLQLGDTVVFLRGQRGIKKLADQDPVIGSLNAALVRNASQDREVHYGALSDLLQQDYTRATVVVRKEWQK